jgi:hypothetical protein
MNLGLSGSRLSAYEARHTVPTRAEERHQRRADKSRGSRDEDSHSYSAGSKARPKAKSAARSPHAPAEHGTHTIPWQVEAALSARSATTRCGYLTH